MLRTFLALCVALVLAGCENDPTGKPYAIENVISDISFKPQHEEDHCVKVCHTDVAPDTWFILFCDTQRANDCFTKEITHAPWKWEVVGAKVVITWQPRRFNDEITNIELEPTEEVVQL